MLSSRLRGAGGHFPSGLPDSSSWDAGPEAELLCVPCPTCLVGLPPFCSCSPSDFQRLLFLLLGLTSLIPQIPLLLMPHLHQLLPSLPPSVAGWPSFHPTLPKPVPWQPAHSQHRQTQHCYSHSETRKPSWEFCDTPRSGKVGTCPDLNLDTWSRSAWKLSWVAR